ncbi:GAF domain-containing protein [Anabaena subtropica]|uniref:GAF domain-containing protein n=1 Tax=Anabaena subtropica FACHB-260 TaxID=2692884 RepID=A0ABR8CL35_9NOST|nr:GAF domain-containing protein [Anabaena subtropica]MBD2343258.1 GAF domain-containing protein [Anabaena subtropica FACHB-260]
MTDQALPRTIQSVLNKYSEPDALFSALLPILGQVLKCDRCFLYLRNPQTKFGKITHCWRRNPDIPDIGNSEWELEPASLPQVDPMFAAALRTAPSIYVEDVETADPTVVNKEFESQNFGHRALIHAHLCHNGQLWGVLQPCVFAESRVWSESDRAIVTQLEGKLISSVVDYVKKSIVHNP